MSAENDYHSLTPTPSTSSASDRGRDTREGAQDDSSTAENNSPPDHGLPTHSAARFLWEVPKDTPISELPELYRRWIDDTEQVDLGRWSE
jgi:hypothetical protein